MRTITTALVLAAALATTTSPVLATPTTAPDRTSVQVVTYDARLLLRPDGSTVRRLRAKGSVPAISPDGTRIAYREGDRLIVKYRGGRVETFPGRGYRPTSWSPDGRMLALSDGRRIATFALATGRRRTVLVGRRHAEPRLPAFSPDGRSIAFTQGDSFDTGLYVIRRDGRQRRTVVSSSDSSFYGVISGFDWSPDGGSFVLSVFDPVGDAPAGLAVVGGDGSGFDFLDRWHGSGGGAAFSPDGTRIAYADDDHDLRILDRDGSDGRRVARRVLSVQDWHADPRR